MPLPFNEETAAVYGNIIDEAKIRLDIIDRALGPHVEDAIGYIAVSDLCSLQFRKAFEAIALGSLLLHGHMPGANRIKDDYYRADKVIEGLERIYPEFYPVPCEVIRGPDGKIQKLRKAIAGEWLTKARLKKAYRLFDDELHIGKLKKRTLDVSPVGRASLVTILSWTRILLMNHVIYLREPRRRLIAEARPTGTVPLITIQTAPDSRP